MTDGGPNGNDMASPDIIVPKLQVVAWELTRSCNLLCAHCRGSADSSRYDGELSTEECFRLIDGIVQVAKPVLILTGGEPLARPDLLEIAKYAAARGLIVVLGTNGTLLTPEIATSLRDVPIFRVGISLDFPSAELQDAFRGQKGAFDAAMAGILNVRQAGIDVQINSTITKRNVAFLDKLLSVALGMGAVAFHPFMLVPTGRGKGLETDELSPEEYERTLNWIYDKQVELGDRIFFKPTDAPHYMRILKQREKSGVAPHPPAHSQAIPIKRGHPVNRITRGCLAGTGFCFISHRGRVQGCGYFDVSAGNVRIQPFGDIWAHSHVFNSLRDLSGLKGKCGRCEYKTICGGCRAHAYEATGDYLEAEPYCVYQPRQRPKYELGRAVTKTDGSLLVATSELKD
ncbi:MAG: radical SAM protein [Chloroflexota bacterium]